MKHLAAALPAALGALSAFYTLACVSAQYQGQPTDGQSGGASLDAALTYERTPASSSFAPPQGHVPQILDAREHLAPASPDARWDPTPTSEDASSLANEVDASQQLTPPPCVAEDLPYCTGPCCPTVLACGWGVDSLVVDTSDVYYTINAPAPDIFAGLFRVPKYGGQPEYLAPLPAGTSSTTKLQQQGDYLFLAAYSSDHVMSLLGWPKIGGALSTVLQGNWISDPHVDVAAYFFGDSTCEPGPCGSAIYSLSRAATPVRSQLAAPAHTPILVDDTYVYYTSRLEVTPGQWHNQVLRVAKTGGSPTLVAEGMPDSVLRALDNTSLFLGTSTGILAIPKAGGAATLVATMTATPDEVAMFASTLYVVVGSALWLVPKDPSSGSPQLLYSGNQQIHAVAVEEDRLYWGEKDVLTLSRLCEE